MAKTKGRVVKTTLRHFHHGQQEKLDTDRDSDKLAPLIELLQSINSGTNTYGKRRKVALESLPEDCETLIVHEEAIVLNLEKPCNTYDSISCVGVHEHLKVRLEAVEEAGRLRLIIFAGSRAILDDGFRCIEGSLSSNLKHAFRVASKDNNSAKAQQYGRLWTNITVELGRLNTVSAEEDLLRLTFTLKWNTTPSLLYMPNSVDMYRNVGYCLNHCLSGGDLTRSEATNSKAKTKPGIFYEAVHVTDTASNESSCLDVPELNVKLYPFQNRTVSWLMMREGVIWSKGNRLAKIKSASNDGVLPYSFQHYTDKSGRKFFASKLFAMATTSLAPFRHVEKLRGGILAEEMGLGKTVEVIALIALHKREAAANAGSLTFDTLLPPTKATLIVTPLAILRQWQAELETHAPGLKVMHYTGIKDHSVEDIMDCDVVLTTYSVLSREIWWAVPQSDRVLRYASERPPRDMSPLTTLLWWRVCLDEAQMVESGASAAAQVAKLIPRVNGWAVTGTPVTKDIADLYGLLNFLQLEPYASFKPVWQNLINDHSEVFRQLFGRIAIRHTKSAVRQELAFKGQKRFVITTQFTATEQQLYKTSFQTMCDDVACRIDGGPTIDGWELDEYASKMRSWLERLRQICLHPEIGEANKRRFGNSARSLGTISEVLKSMIVQADVSIRQKKRELLLRKLRRGQYYENSPRVLEALELWSDVRSNAELIVAEEREAIAEESLKSREQTIATELSSDTFDTADDDSSHTSTLRNRLRGALEVLHAAIFFQSNAYFQLMEKTTPESEDYKRLEKLQTTGYEAAKTIRQEVLKDIFARANHLMSKLKAKKDGEEFVHLPALNNIKIQGGIGILNILARTNQLIEALHIQGQQIQKWRSEIVQVLLRPLVDKEDQVEISGEEYEESTLVQDELMVRLHALRAVVEDRQDAISGHENALVKSEAATALKMAANGEGHNPKKLIELFQIRHHIKPARDFGSLRSTISDLMTVKDKSSKEIAITAEELLKKVRIMSREESHAVEKLRSEVRQFTQLVNIRLEYYKQFQELSDMVAPLEEPDWNWHDASFAEEAKLQGRINQENGTRRFLLFTQDKSGVPQLCTICTELIEVGTFTACGHMFCKECLSRWMHQRRACPICKTKLAHSDLYHIAPSARKVHIAEEVVSAGKRTADAAIYSSISGDVLSQINEIELTGRSYSTKIDAIARHVTYLRTSDPGSKSVIFSQFREFIDVLATAFSQYGISFSTFDKRGGSNAFVNDPSIECFLFHGKAQASGLNLVCASYVFLCEPLINTAVELQAIARVDRIGQLQKTNVYLYLVQGTVEESVYDISVKKRMEHIFAGGKGKGKNVEEGIIEAANSAVLEEGQAALKALGRNKSVGENVAADDLWACLFGNAQFGQGNNNDDAVPEVDSVIRREMGAHAAEQRSKDAILED